MKEPKLRFPEFIGNWKQYKISEVGNIVTGSTPKTSISENYGGDFLFVSPADIQGNRYIDKTITTLTKKGFDQGRKIREKASLFVSIGSTIGKVAQTRQELTTNQQINAVEPYNNFDDDFIFTSLENVAANIKAIASNQAVPIVNKTTFGNVEIRVPSELVEQQKIGSLFAELDTLIQSAEKELEGYRELKQGMLQKMFPKKGEKVPEIRFPEFSGEWKKYELGDVLNDMYNGQTQSRSKPNYWNGDVKWLSSGELNRQTVYDSIESITEEGRKSANLRIIPKGTFVMAITGLEAAGTRGNCALLGFNTTLNQSCMALFPNENLLTTKFLFQWYKNVGEEYGITYTQGTKQQSYNAQLLEILPISLPTIKEQNKITCLLEEIDNLITLQQQELDGYKELKKGLLQQMFC